MSADWHANVHKVVEAARLERVIHTRRRIEKALRVTSASSIDDQMPQ